MERKLSKIVRLQLEVDSKLKKKIAHAAVDAGLTMRELITGILTEFLRGKN